MAQFQLHWYGKLLTVTDRMKFRKKVKTDCREIERKIHNLYTVLYIILVNICWIDHTGNDISHKELWNQWLQIYMIFENYTINYCSVTSDKYREAAHALCGVTYCDILLIQLGYNFSCLEDFFMPHFTHDKGVGLMVCLYIDLGQKVGKAIPNEVTINKFKILYSTRWNTPELAINYAALHLEVDLPTFIITVYLLVF